MSAVMRRIAGAAAAAALALAACGQDAGNKPEEIRPVRVMRIGAESAARSVEYAGEVRARHETRLGFRVGGKIVARLVDVGARVSAGQPIARLDPADLVLAEAAARAQLAAVEAERDLAKSDFERYRELRVRKFISQAEFDRRASALATAESRLDAVRAQHRQTANQVGYATLPADSDGVITAIEAETGQVVAAGQTVARLARPGELEVAFAVPESQFAMVEQAHEFSVTLNSRPGRHWHARLRELSPAADPATRTYGARATIVDPGSEVELGMSARVGVTAGAGEARIEVPLSALYAKGETPQVFLVDDKSVVRLQAVKTGGVAGDRVVIASGLAPGDVIVSAGAQLLRPGQRVRVLRDGN